MSDHEESGSLKVWSGRNIITSKFDFISLQTSIVERERKNKTFQLIKF